MEFTLSEDQTAIIESVNRFVVERVAPNALEWERREEIPRDLLLDAARLGLGGICVDPQFGGAGLSRLDAALIFEALAIGCPTVASYISIHNMCAWMVDRFGSAEQRHRWLPKLCSMEQLASFCLTESGCGSDAAALTTAAQPSDRGYLLKGRKCFISGGGVSDLYVVMCRTGASGPKGVSAMLVSRDTAGLSFGANERKMGYGAQSTADVVFDNVLVAPQERLGAEGKGFGMAMAALDGGRLNIAACSLGGAQSALNKAIEYAQSRLAFGRKLSEFQTTQFKLADMETALQSARVFLYQAAWKLDRGLGDARRFCAMAKRLATDAGFDVANSALQLHGGYGYLRDFGIEKIVRDLRVHQILEGTNEIMRVIISRDMGLGGESMHAG